MKNYFSSLLVILFAVFVFSNCKEEPTSVQNSKPEISNIIASKTVVDWEESISLQVVAVDADGDELTYIWSATGGEFTTQISKNTVTWRASSSDGNVVCSVIVGDGKSTSSGNVEINVAAKTILWVSSSSLDFGAATSSELFSIENQGKGEMKWEISTNSSWINISNTQGITSTERDDIQVIVDRNNLAPDTYQGIITITNNSAENDQKTITVNMEVPVPGEWLYYDDGSFEGSMSSSAIGGSGSIAFVRFTKPSGWNSTKVTKVKIYVANKASESFGIIGYDDVQYSNSLIFPLGSSLILKTNTSQSTGWATHEVAQVFNNNEFFVGVYFWSADGPSIGYDIVGSGNSTKRSGAGDKTDNSLKLWNDIEYGIRIYVEEGSDAASTAPGKKGRWLDADVMLEKSLLDSK